MTHVYSAVPILSRVKGHGNSETLFLSLKQGREKVLKLNAFLDLFNAMH